MAREFFKNLPDTSTPITATRINGLLNGAEAMGSIVVEDVIGKNLFDKDDVIDNYYITQGKLTYDTNMCCSNSFIKVEPNKTYTFSCGSKSTIFIEEYDANKTYIKLNSNWDKTEVSITTQSTTEYVRLSFTKATKDTAQFEKGTTATEYTPYKKYGYNSQESMGKIVVDDVVSKNRFNSEFQKGVYLYADGTYSGGASALNNYLCTKTFTEVKAGETIHLSLNYASAQVGFIFYNDAGTFVSSISNATATVPEGATKCHINIQKSSTATSIELSDIKWVQIEPGDKATPYTPYKNFEGRIDIITGQEMPTNEYVDGKRVYVKRIDFGALPNTTTKSVAHGITNFTLERFNAKANTGTYYINLPHVSTTLAGNIQIGVSATAIEITTGQDRSGFTGVVDIYYTKPTDTQTASTMSLRPDTTEQGELDG